MTSTTVDKPDSALNALRYEQMDPITHIHRRPDMYVGYLENTVHCPEWIFDGTRMALVEKPVYSDGLWRIFLEPLVNAVDNVWRSRQQDVPCRKIVVDWGHPTPLTISIWNDGLYIPVEKDEKSGKYIPEMIFGQLLTSSNYDDKEMRWTSGRNGLGVKLSNVFATRFRVECADPRNKVVFIQTWTQNMRVAEKAIVKNKASLQKGYTHITFDVDGSRFGVDQFDEMTRGLFFKSCADASAVSGVPVLVNGQRLTFSKFVDYALLYPPFCPEDQNKVVAWDNIILDPQHGTRIQVVVRPLSASAHTDETESTDKSVANAYHVSFVNGIYTRDGGTHVEAVMTEFFKHLLSKVRTSKTTFSLKDVKPFFRFFVQAWVPNPVFDTQSKTRLRSAVPKIEMDAKKVQSVISKWGIDVHLQALAQAREMQQLRKTERGASVRAGIQRVEGLDHANRAGHKHGKDCTLILCEGLSAKTYAVTGMQVGWNGRKGRDYFGVFALRGKVLNVRNASPAAIAANKEISNIIQALQLKYNTDYTDEKHFASLAYGKVLIIADADVDGLHITSLIVNVFHALFPSLLRRPFLYWMMTPVAKIIHRTQSMTFFHDYGYQQQLLALRGQPIRVKYYKGLGTSSDQEVKETFGSKVVRFVPDDRADKHMKLVFQKTESDARKRWLETYDPTRYLVPSDEYDLSSFLNQDLIRFSIDDCKRNIPSLFDGLKLSQRKILFSVFRKKLTPSGASMKVAQLAGYVAEQSNYHHGEQCLYDTITRMAQDFVGSNNLPLLAKDGQFGSRSHLGKDAANGRYIFTKLLPYTRALFPQEDDDLLPYTLDDGDRVEPDYYAPILPLILINGCRTGIGSGWSCSVPSFDPAQIMSCVFDWLQSNEKGVPYTMPELTPWYRHFRGRIERVGEHKYRSHGVIRELDPNAKKSKQAKETHEVCEVPIDVSIDRFKEYLEKLVEERKLDTLRNYSTPNEPKFHIRPTAGFSIDGIQNTSDLYLSNMVLFHESKIQKYNSIQDIFHSYCTCRLALYGRRRLWLLEEGKKELETSRWQSQFLQDVLSKKLTVFREPEDSVRSRLKTLGYPEELHGSLLATPIRKFTQEELDRVNAELDRLRAHVQELERTKPADMWRKDLERLRPLLPSS